MCEITKSLPIAKIWNIPWGCRIYNSCPSGGCYFCPQGQPSDKRKHTYLLPSVGFELDIWLTVVTVFFSTYLLHWVIAPIIREEFGTTTGYYAIRSSTSPSWHISGQNRNVRVAVTMILPTLSANPYKLLFVSTTAARSHVKGQDPIRLWAVLTLNHNLSSHQRLCGWSMTHGSESGHLVQLAGHLCQSWTRQNIPSTHTTMKHFPIITLRPSVKKGKDTIITSQKMTVKEKIGHCQRYWCFKKIWIR